jgi:hypothetical protein
MPLAIVTATHVRVTCDGCRKTTAELCGKREIAATAAATAVPKFKAAGWHHDAGDHVRSRTEEQVEREGAGRWYCPACSRQTHL